AANGIRRRADSPPPVPSRKGSSNGRRQSRVRVPGMHRDGRAALSHPEAREGTGHQEAGAEEVQLQAAQAHAAQGKEEVTAPRAEVRRLKYEVRSERNGTSNLAL